MTMTNNYLVWENYETGERVRSASRPAGAGRWDAIYNLRRVGRRGYVAYAGRNEWERAANAAMARNCRQG